MSYFAKVENGLVTQVIVADQSFVNAQPGVWVETTKGPNAPRKNFAGIGFSYDPMRDAFIPPKPYPSWLLNESTCLWYAPVPAPTDGQIYYWDEESQSWK